MMNEQLTPSPIHVSVLYAVDDARRGADRHTSQARPASLMAANSALIKQLMAYADGRSADGDTRARIEAVIIDYIDGLLDLSLARDLERAMRLSPVVARLVADKAEEIDLRNRLSMYFDGELDEAAGTEIERLIDRDPHVAALAADMRRGGDLLQVALQPIPGQVINQPDVASLRRTLESPTGEGDPIVRFSALILYATGVSFDEKNLALLEKAIDDYVDGALDRRAVRGLEAAMRLSPSLARLIADRIVEAGA